MPHPTTIQEFAEARRDHLQQQLGATQQAVRTALSRLAGDPAKLIEIRGQDAELAELRRQLRALPAAAPEEQRAALVEQIAQVSETIDTLDAQIGLEQQRQRRVDRLADLNRQIRAKRAELAGSPTGADADQAANEFTALLVAQCSVRSRLLALETQLAATHAEYELQQQLATARSVELRKAEQLVQSEIQRRAGIQQLLHQLADEPLTSLAGRASQLLQILATLEPEEPEEPEEGGEEGGDNGGENGGENGEGNGGENGGDGPGLAADPLTNSEAAVLLARQAMARVEADVPEALLRQSRNRLETLLEQVDAARRGAAESELALADQRAVVQGLPAVVAARRVRLERAERELTEQARSASQWFAAAIGLLTTITSSAPLTAAEAAALRDPTLDEPARRAAAPDAVWLNVLLLRQARRLLQRLRRTPEELRLLLEDTEQQLVAALVNDSQQQTVLDQLRAEADMRQRAFQYSESASQRLLIDAVRGS